MSLDYFYFDGAFKRSNTILLAKWASDLNFSSEVRHLFF